MKLILTFVDEKKGTFKLAIFWGVERFYCELDLLHFSINIKLFIMNKKFSTLFAGVALLGATSVFAADNEVKSLVEGTNTGLYQLQIGENQFLSVDENDKLSVVTDVDADNVASTLWCVTVTEENKGKAPYFDFVNKGAEALLTVTMEEFAAGATETTEATVGGEISGWAFSSTYKELEAGKPLYSYFTADSVVGLVVEDDGTVVLKKAIASNVNAADFATFTLVKADAVTLNAEQINTKLGIQKKDAGVQLTFDPDANKTSLKNPFSQELFLAAQVEGEDFVYITRKADAKALFVDTAYINTTGTMFLAFDYMKDLVTLKASDLEEHGQFLFTYFPTNDSLVIQVKTIIKEPAEKGYWKDGAKTTLTADAKDFNYVTVQDLVEADKIRVVTIGAKKETDIKLGFTSCEESDTDRVSLEDGVYFIQSAKTNKYYASPIHFDGQGDPQWVSVDADEQNVNHMPAYQWVVLKTKTSEYFAATSPVDVVNREYVNLDGNYQFTQAKGSSKYFCEEISADSLVITPVDKEFLGKEYLGYKYLTDDELMITNYAFNYFNPYTMEKYIAQVAGSNKLNVLQSTPTYFEIKPVSDNVAVDYGYKVTADVKKRIEGLVQLKRAAYTINTKNAFIAVGEEDNFVITDKGAASKFFFKENNQLDATCYYAFVDADMNADGSFKFKAGVADQSLTALLQQQVINEVRTSAFSIGLANQPLYRRFNSVELDGAVEGNEDATKLLKFKEAYVNDYLMDETNENFKRKGMSYLGIGAANIAEAGLSFNVRPYNIGKSAQYQIKPQYLIYVSETENEGTEDDLCDICGKKDCEHSTLGVPGFKRYKLLVSFADSAKKETSNTVSEEQLYKFGRYTRVGFVDAVEQDSVIYILGNTFANVATKDLNMDDVKKALEAKKISSINMKTTVKEDIHHNYTWSFRYIDPTKAAEEFEDNRAFLIESNADKAIAPENAAWIKNQNNCLVLSDMDASFEDAKTGGDAALIFNIEKGAADDMATDNESISASEVSVVATNGAVIIKGAEGKTVAISNVLGQTIASTVITSSEATISVPAGVVVVAVEGEAAVKAIVK